MEQHTSPPGQDIQRKRQQLAHLSMVHISDLHARLEELPPRDRALGAVTLMDDLRSQLELVSRVRTAAIMELRAEGLSVSSIAIELGIPANRCTSYFGKRRAARLARISPRRGIVRVGRSVGLARVSTRV